ncbi:hypothetical protein [uncultured Desulfuromonas sp.]|jgi:hypothetical protein|uniref:hypothetical protein n=1 Tax=uncultured Desulfuromonas sp. TaxID=181013 RepID=UPI002AAB38E4|nr:hypothetical protein [uncultured Desulfuromonas sp.]
MSDLLQSVTLENGLHVAFSDETVRYFGDYHRIQIDVFVVLEDGRREQFQRLERMGISGDMLDESKREVMGAFRANCLPYMASNGFPDKFIASLKRRKVKLLAGLR